MKIKILIPYASYGNGHRAIAEYIKNYFEKDSPKYEVVTLDLLVYSIPVIGELSKKFSTALMLRYPLLWSVIYNFFNNRVSSSVYKSVGITLFKNKKLTKFIKEFNPNLTISTHFFGSNLIAYYNKKSICNSKLITVITDYEAHEIWIKNNNNEDAIVVGNKEEVSLIVKRGIDRNKIKAFGIPIAPIIPSDFNKEKALRKYGFLGIRPVCLFFAGGSDGNKAVLPYLKKVLDSKLNIDFLFISGSNKYVKKKALELVEENNANNIRIFGFVTNVPELFELCDFVITKPGGAQSTEALYFKKPAIMINSSGGQEKANMKYFVKNGYGKKFSFPFTFIKYLNKVSKNPDILSEMQNNLNKNTNNEAMKKLFDLANEIIKK